MGSFFDPYYPDDFVMFSTSHWVTLFIFFVLMIGLYVYRKQIQANLLLKNSIRYLILIALIIPEATLNIWYVVTDVWQIKRSLPLELCSISIILAIIMLITRSKLLYQIVFFAGILGALQALLTPDLGYPYPHFRFFHFFIAHMAIILSALYMTWIEKYRPTWKSVGITMIFLNVLLVVVGGINYFLGANYMYLMHKPDTPSLLDLLGPHPYYLIVEEGVALILCVLMYLIFFAIPGWVKKRISIK